MTYLSHDSLTWTSEEFDNFLQDANASDILFVDTETNGEDIRDGRGFCMGISLSFGVGSSVPSAYFPLRHPSNNLGSTHIRKLIDLLETHTCLVFHNAKFDIVSLGTLGVKFNWDVQTFYDTMLMAHWINENEWSLALDALVKKYTAHSGKVYSDDFNNYKKLFGWAGIPSSVMAEYAATDAYILNSLFQYLYPRFVEQGFDGGLWEIEQRFILLIISMERDGIRINVDLAQSNGDLGRDVLETLKLEVGWNLGSPKQIGEYLIDKLGLPVVKLTPAGKPSFDKEAMIEYVEMLERLDDPVGNSILEYRGWQKATTSCYEPYVQLLSPDGRLRPNYKLHGTVTGRLSCEKPNLQQIPKTSTKPWNGAMKQCFIPADGYELWEADYAQLELRLGAAYARQTNLLEIFADDSRDVFTEMSNQLGMSRFDTKTLTYSIQYGAGPPRIQHVFQVSQSRAQGIIDNYYNTYPGFKAAQDRAVLVARKKKYVQLWSGKRRHFAHPEEYRKAFNAAIQGGSADIVKRSGLRVYDTVCNEECRILLQVHDSYVFEIKRGREDVYLPRIREAMERTDEDFGVHFKVDIHKWGE